MVQVDIVYELSNGFVVDFDGTLYVLSDNDLLFSGSRVYTYPNKLVQRYYA